MHAATISARKKFGHKAVVSLPVHYSRELFEGVEAPVGTGNPRRESKVVLESWQTSM